MTHHQPKGSMCQTCCGGSRACATLPFSSMPVMNFPGLDDHAALSPLGVKYLRKAFKAAAQIKQTKDFVDLFFSEYNQSSDRWTQAMWNVSESAAKAADLCSIAHKEIEGFQRKHRIIR